MLQACRDPRRGGECAAALGQGQMKPEQLEIDRLRREVTKLKAERGMLKRQRLTARESRCEVRRGSVRACSGNSLTTAV